MSQKSAPPTIVRSRVSSGIPWWIWGMIAVVGCGLIFAVIRKSMSEDPAALFTQAVAAAENRNGPVLEELTGKLRTYPEYASQSKMLEGILLLTRSRPVKAIPLLEQAAEEKSIRSRAMLYLGMAYSQAEKYDRSISTFETLIQEDENSLAARQNLSALLAEDLSWEDALIHLNFLVDKEFQLSRVLKARADILFELEEFENAADDFEGSIKADSTDPSNSVKADRLIKCVQQTGDLKKLEPYVEMIDRPSVRNLVRAEKQLADNDLAGAVSTLEAIRRETPNDGRANLIYARTMLQYNTPEKAFEALSLLQQMVLYSPRDVQLFVAIRDLAHLAQEEPLAAVAQQNVDGLNALMAEYKEVLSAVIRTRIDNDSRLRLAKLAEELGRYEVAAKCYGALLRANPDKHSEYEAKTMNAYNLKEPLVGLGSAGSSTKAATPNTSAPSASPQLPNAPEEQVPAETTTPQDGKTDQAPPATEPSGSAEAQSENAVPENSAAEPAGAENAETPEVDQPSTPPQN